MLSEVVGRGYLWGDRDQQGAQGLSGRCWSWLPLARDSGCENTSSVSVSVKIFEKVETSFQNALQNSVVARGWRQGCRVSGHKPDLTR